ncbi:armadillo-type protein [Choanephora cucurbitarum]|nr:armadillo-type protein [Choanephora cucurbitarum]
MGSQAYQIPPDTLHYLILEFLTLVPEEVQNANLIGGRKLQLIDQLKEGIPLALSTISALLFSVEIQPVVQQKAMRCLQSWIQYGFDLEKGYPILQQVMSLLGNEDVFEQATEVLLESMQQSNWAKYQTYRNDLLTCFTSQGMREKFETSIAEEDEETARLLAKLFSTFGETYTDFIVMQLARPDVEWLMHMIMQLTGFQGYFPVDQEVSEIPLNFWYIMQETLFDESILPIREPTAADEEDAEKKVWMVKCGQTAIAIYKQLVKVLIQNARYPDDSTWDSWNKDVKDKFKIWRRDLGDTMINPYYVLRDEMLQILLDHIAYIINQWASLSDASQLLEATLFCLKSITEEISPEENVYIQQLFGLDILGRFPNNCGARLTNTSLLLMGSLADWLKVHPQFLGPVMNYIVPCLSDRSLALAASSAFSDICDNCRESLVNELDNLMHVYAAMSKSQIKVNFMQKVVESVADVIQVLPPDRAMAPLMTLAGDILQGISSALKSIDTDPQAAHDAVLVQLQYLTACCRGIQSPNDDYQSLIQRNSSYDTFAASHSAALYAHIEGFQEITFAIRELTAQITQVWSSDEAIVKALSTFLEQGMRSTSPLLSLSFHDLVVLIEKSYSTAPYACWLNTASMMMTVYGGQEHNKERLRDLLGSVTNKTIEFINGTEAMEQYPDVVDNYFGLLSRAITRCPFSFYRLPTSMIDTIFMFVIAGMGQQERLALKAALNFMVI